MMNKTEIAEILAHAFKTARHILNETPDNGFNHAKASEEMVDIVKQARFYDVFEEFEKLL